MQAFVEEITSGIRLGLVLFVVRIDCELLWTGVDGPEEGRNVGEVGRVHDENGQVAFVLD